MISEQTKKRIDWAAATFILPGESDCGDLFLVREFEEGALFAVIDGLGHGTKAALAAKAAVAALNTPEPEPLTELMERCHRKLMSTHGVVMTLAYLDWKEEVMTWLGVGNVDARIFRSNHSTISDSDALFPRGGVVGYQLPSLRSSIVPIKPEDFIIFFTDGIAGNIRPQVNPEASVQQVADHILSRSAKGSDDALVLVVKYLGNKSATDQS